jgi:hypothetical protein
MPAVVDRVVYFKAEKEAHPSSQGAVANDGNVWWLMDALKMKHIAS